MELEEFIGLYRPLTTNADTVRGNLELAYGLLQEVGLTESMTPKQAQNIILIYQLGRTTGHDEAVELRRRLEAGISSR